MGNKFDQLVRLLIPCCPKGIVLGFSGGVDSTFLLVVLSMIRQKISFPLAAVMMYSSFQKEQERHEAERLTKQYHVPFFLKEYDPLSIPEVKFNSRERCYFCKKHFFSGIREFAQEKKMELIFDGTNADDLTKYRPGLKAIKELGIRSPLAECGLTKEDIRAISREFKIPTAEKTAEPCLATRFEYGMELTPENLKLVSTGESVIRSFVPDVPELRLRMEKGSARIELSPDWIPELLRREPELRKEIQRLGFSGLTIDPRGYRSGSFDENNDRGNFKDLPDL